MKQLLAIIKKELKGYIDHPIAYVLAVVFLVLNNFIYFRTSLVQEVASLRSMFNLIPWVLLFFISALTMRTWAEERKEKTLSVLLSYPVKVWQLIVGKYLATVIFVTAMLALTLFIPISLRSVGQFDWGVILAQYLGTFFMILAAIAIGQWASSLTKNQVVSFIISIAVLFIFFFIGLDFVVLALPYPLSLIAQQLGLLSHFNALTRGVLDARDILYFVSVGFLFLTLSYAWLSRKKTVRGSKDWRTLQTSVILVIAIAIVINLFGQSFTVRADLTEQNLYSLSNATKTTLKNLDDSVRLTLYRSKKLPTQIELVSRDVQDILSDYQKFGGRHVDYAVKFPDEDEEVATEAKQNGIPAIRFNVVREDEFTLQNGYLGLVIEYLDEKESIPFIQTIDDLEYRLTSSILGLLEDKQYRLGYVSDFGGKTLEELSAFSGVIQEVFTIEEIKLASEEETETIPEILDVDVLMIAAPTQRYSDQAIEAIRSYIDKGGKIFWLVSGINVDQASLSAAVNTTGLEDLLKEKGITINQDLVADLQSHETVNFSAGIFSYLLPYPFWVKANLEKHVLAGNIAQVSLPWSSSISIDSENSNIKILVKTTPAGVVQRDSFIVNPEQLNSLPQLDQGEYVLGATVQDIESAEGDAGRWVVLASNGMLDNSMLQQYPTNAALAINSLDWLVQNEVLLSIRTKSSRPAALIWESDSQQSRIKWGNIIGLPILIVVFGIAWILRRKRRAKLRS